MGLLSGIGKAVKKVFKGVGKVFKAIGKGVKKLFSSTFGKVLLVAAAVFFGGMALGLWASPFATTAAAGSTAAGTAMAAETVTGVASTAGGLAEVAGIPGAAAAGGSAVAGASVGGGVGTAAGTMTSMPIAEAVGTTATGLGGATGSASGLVGSALAPVSAATGPVIQGAGAASGGLWGTLTGAASSASAWMNTHPMLTMMGGNMLSSMFTPSKAEEEIEVEEWKRENSTIAGIGYDGSGPGIDLAKMKNVSGQYNLSSPLPFGPAAQLDSASKYVKSSYDPDYYNREEEKRKRNAGLLKQGMAGG